MSVGVSLNDDYDVLMTKNSPKGTIGYIPTNYQSGLDINELLHAHQMRVQSELVRRNATNPDSDYTPDQSKFKVGIQAGGNRSPKKRINIQKVLNETDSEHNDKGTVLGDEFVLSS